MGTEAGQPHEPYRARHAALVPSAPAPSGGTPPGPYGQFQPVAAPSPTPVGEEPTVWPVVVITLLLGVLGVIFVFVRARRARRMGYPTSRYWLAFCLSAVVSLVVWYHV
ncbi:MAG TPA: hypothetical protein VJT31_22460 [Rugosimonospora sp.]|nr:hypothetical protein [Rugosimonospora sp.]